MRWIACTIAAAMTAGCNTVERLAARHTDANQVQADATNQQLLLNVVRAASREPMHFSRIPEVALAEANPSLGALTIPFGNSTGKEYTLTGAGAIATQTVRVVPQDSQDFLQGLMQPVSAELLNYHFEQGWPARLTLALMVERIVVRLDGEEFRLDGHTGEECTQGKSLKRARAFYGLIDALKDHDVGLEDYDRFLALGPPVAASAAQSQLAGLAALAASGATLQLDPKTGSWSPGKASKRWRLQFGNPTGMKLRFQDLLKGLTPTVARSLDSETDATMVAYEAPTKSEAPGQTDKFANFRIELNLRSPAAMLYYMGELVRSGSECRDRVLSNKDGGWSASGEHKAQLWPVIAYVTHAGPNTCGGFALKESDASRPVFVSVTHRGCRFTVLTGTKPETDRTAQAFALVKQVLELQHKGAAAPAPVRVLSP